jgi:hypothetical protein
MALGKVNGTSDLFYKSFFYDILDDDSFTVIIRRGIWGEHYFYDINGDKIPLSSWGGAGSGIGFGLLRLRNNSNPIPEVKGFKSDSVDLYFYISNPIMIEIPIPKNSERIETDIAIPFGQYIYKITEVWRRGNSIFIEDNGIQKVETEIQGENRLYWIDNIQMIPGTPDYEIAVANREAIIRAVQFDTDEAKISTRNGRIEIVDFNENAGAILLKPYSANITQYGNFDIEFD